MRPIGDRTVCLDRSIIRRNAVDVVRFDPVLRAESRGKGEFFHRLLDEDGGAYFGEFVDFRNRLTHFVEVVADGGIGSEVEIIFEHVGIFVPMAVKILQDKPVCIEYFFGFWARNRIE